MDETKLTQADAVYYKRLSEDLQRRQEDLVAAIARANLNRDNAKARMDNLAVIVDRQRKMIAQLRLENDALRNLVPTDGELDIPEAPAESTDIESPPKPVSSLPALSLDPYEELKVPRFN